MVFLENVLSIARTNNATSRHHSHSTNMTVRINQVKDYRALLYLCMSPIRRMIRLITKLFDPINTNVTTANLKILVSIFHLDKC